MKVEPLPVDHRIPAAPGSLRIVDQRISSHLDCCAHQAHNRAIMDIHCLNRLSITLQTVRRHRSLKRSCATLVLKMVNFQFIVTAPAQVRTSHSLSCNLHWECKITATKFRRNSLWFTHRPQECTATSLVRIRHPSLRTAIRDGRHKSQGILVRARCDHCRRA